MALVSIIIPAHNAEKTLRACLTACACQTYPETEIIVVDDGSTDATTRIAQSFPVRFVHQERRGPAAARNAGATRAQGAFLACTDSDCVPRPDWIERLVAGFSEGVVAVGGTYGIANPESLLAQLIHEEIMVRHEGFSEEVDFLGSFNVAYRKSAFDAAGGFDEDFTSASGEDNDLAYRLADAGGRLRFVREAIVDHHHPQRLARYLRSQFRHGFWRMKLYAKHPGRSSGDRYAGPADLLAPVIVCLIAIFLGFGLAAGFRMQIVCATLILCALLAASRISMPWRMTRRTGDLRMLLFIPVMLLRDVARAAGMLGGIWTFLFVRRKSA
jgi:GT2 family glycosyltransferase